MDEVRTYYSDIKKVASITNLPWNKLSGKNILITGATGLIGGCLVDILMNRDIIDFNLYASGRNYARIERFFKQYLKHPSFHFIEMDVTDNMNSNIPFHYIISCASGANPLEYSIHPVETIMTNILGVYNLMKYGLDNQLEKFIYISSGDVYGEGDGRVFSEDYSGYVNPLILRSCYPSSKRASESLCIAYASQYGIDTSIVRPCHIYGSRFTDSDTRAYAQFIRNAVAGESIVLKSSGTHLRSWCYVVDCASAILYVTLLGNKGEAYNVADNTSVLSIRAFAELVASSVNSNVVYDVPNNLESSGFNTVTKSLFDTKKIRSLGWRPIGTISENIVTVINDILARIDNKSFN